MQTEQQFSQLLEKYLNGKTTPSEKAIIEQWFEQGGNQRKPDMELTEANRAQILSNIHAIQNKAAAKLTLRRKNTLRTLFTGWRAAAVWTALLTTAGIAGWKSGIIKPLSGNNEAIAYRSIQTGKAEIKQVRLPDGSVVVINAQSKLEYHPDFATYRKIRLQGEALFTVAHDKTHPFTVITNDSLATTVLGTRFNIQSYDQGQETRITVVSGIVAVNKGQQSLDTLTRSAAIRYQKSTRNFHIVHDVNTESVTSWTKGEWDFENLRFNDLAILLHNHYGINLRSRQHSELLQTTVSVNFNSKQTAKEILEVFCAFAGCSFREISATEYELH